jgi:alkylation response protein AidB-like acyl-CoA dehydrogenase
VTEGGELQSERFMARERATLESFLPGLATQLSRHPLADLEQPNGVAIEAFRQKGGPGLLIPHEHGGLGASAVEALDVQRAVGSLAPSLAVASTMHHFSVATLVELSSTISGFEWLILGAIAEQKRLVASGFSEGMAGRGVLEPQLQAQLSPAGYVVNGVKKPCSLSASMDLLTASVRLENGDIAVALIAADSPGLGRQPFWSTPILAGAESDEVVLEDVVVEERLVMRLDTAKVSGGSAQARGFVWFELLIAASYLGVASALVERVLHAERIPDDIQLDLIVETEAGAAALESAARVAEDNDKRGQALCRSLLIRYAVQDAITRVVSSATQALGGIAFLSSPEVAYLGAAARALAFHPPSRRRNAPSLVDAALGRPFVIG